tara:strand:+ start:2232 stop:2507 length:276 start_codon:yes stop_codon:yes gene_type:complete
VPNLSPCELAGGFTDIEDYFVLLVTAHCLLKSLDLITCPAFFIIKVAEEFREKTTSINQLWPTDLNYLKVICRGCMYLSTILHDYPRYIIT